MSGVAGRVLDLSPGAGVLLDGVAWRVASVAPQLGAVELRDDGGRRKATTVRALLNDPKCAPGCPPAGTVVARTGIQPVVLGDLSREQQELLGSRFAHVQEAETGFRSGSAFSPLPGEPRPGYDPETTTVTARRRAKVAEITALGPEVAARIGFAHVSERTLKRLGAACRRYGMLGCVNGAWLRRSTGHQSITEEIREAIFAVRAETLHRSRLSMRSRERLIHQYVRERFGDDVIVPSYPTLRRVWGEWFGSGGARQKYQRSGAALRATGEHVVVHRPGQVVALDTTVLPVKVCEHVFGDPVSVHLTMALDAYTHSLVGFRFTLVSDTSVDVAMLLRDIVMPLPLREDWGPAMAWPYPGIPASVVGEFAGYPVAALPFFTPETITTDHGSVYRNHHLVEVQRVLGINILPSRVLRPTDKQAIERAFGAVQSLLFEVLPGWTGVDVADRGADPEADAVLTVAELENLLATWIVGVWQNRQLGEHAPAWDPGGHHSPNTLFAAALGQGGFALQVPGPELFYDLLPAHHVKIHARRGVKILGLWYDGPALDAYRDGVSSRGGAHAGKWVVRRDPRERRYVFFADPLTHEWHQLRWVGLGEQDQVPSFGDTRVSQLLRAAKAAGLTPKSDTELLPLLLDLIGANMPVDRWSTQMTRAQRGEHAREAAQADAAAADRPTEPTSDQDDARRAGEHATPHRPGTDHRAGAGVGAGGSANRATDTIDALDEQRRRRREKALAGKTITLPGPLGQSVRGGGLLIALTHHSDDPGDDEPRAPGRDPDDGAGQHGEQVHQ